MSRYLVTGGSGRLGRSVVTVLAEAGHEVISIDKVQRPALPARQLDIDLLDGEATRAAFLELQPDGVVHLAAISVPFSLPDPRIFSINTSLAFSVLEASVAAGADSLLMASSPTVIGYGCPAGWKPATLPIDERHPRAPWNGYSLSKVAVEELVDMAVRQGGDIRLGSFRPCYVVAPEEWEGAPTQQGHTIAERLDDPALSAVALFNYLDARDGGDFVLAWLERAHQIPNGSRFFVAAEDSLVREPVSEALARYVPETAELAAKLDPEAAVFSSELAQMLLGWRAHRSWRTELGTRMETERA